MSLLLGWQISVGPKSFQMDPISSGTDQKIVKWEVLKQEEKTQEQSFGYYLIGVGPPSSRKQEDVIRNRPLHLMDDLLEHSVVLDGC